MQGDIVFVDYERSSWGYMNYERSFRQDDLEDFKIGGQSTAWCDTISPFIDVPFVKGGGSAYGGKWKPSPSKPGDQRLVGTPGEIKVTYTRQGEKFETLIGDDGMAVKEIHYTDHGNPNIHTNPHGHIITFEHGYPDWGKPINGIDSDCFKMFKGVRKMPTIIYDTSTPEDNRFKTISDFKWCMKCGGEVQFDWKGVSYCCFGCVCPAPGKAPRMVICQAGSAEVNAQTEKWCDTAV